MVKIRKLASLEKGLEEITRILTEEEIKKAINKGVRTLENVVIQTQILMA